MVFTTLVCFALVGIAIWINMTMNDSFKFVKEHFEVPFYGKIGILVGADQNILEVFCPTFIEDMVSLHDTMGLFITIEMIFTFGMLT